MSGVLTRHQSDPLTRNPIMLDQSFLAEDPSRRIPSEINRDVDHSRHLLYSVPSTLNRALAGSRRPPQVGEFRSPHPVWSCLRLLESGYTPSWPQLVRIFTDLPTSGRRLVVQPAQFRSDLGWISDAVINSAIRSVACKRLAALTRV